MTYAMRKATAADAAVIAHHRVAMFRDMGILGGHDVGPLEAASRDYLRVALANGEYRGWLLETGDAVAAGGGLVIRRLLPRPGHLQGGEEGYLLNVYTEPAHRRRGLARQLTTAMLDWCREQGINRVSLHASDEGRPLYEQLGFAPTNEMRWE